MSVHRTGREIWPRSSASQLALGLSSFLIGAGVTHFVAPKFYEPMIPAQVPGTPRQWVYGSGLLELAIGAAIAVPPTRSRAALAAAALFVAVFPGNVQMAVDAQRSKDATAAWKAATLARLPLQVPLIVWALKVARS